jgi:hypothetical protein
MFLNFFKLICSIYVVYYGAKILIIILYFNPLDAYLTIFFIL